MACDQQSWVGEASHAATVFIATQHCFAEKGLFDADLYGCGGIFCEEVG